MLMCLSGMYIGSFYVKSKKNRGNRNEKDSSQEFQLFAFC